ncbi:MAG: methyltransferase domain-containing protein, partial [Candidatus Omnitrophica bacterium]|nr:methyltransferase domain-containing protein [Candidatus Omnitrophota bacterium]
MANKMFERFLTDERLNVNKSVKQGDYHYEVQRSITKKEGGKGPKSGGFALVELMVALAALAAITGAALLAINYLGLVSSTGFISLLWGLFFTVAVPWFLTAVPSLVWSIFTAIKPPPPFNKVAKKRLFLYFSSASLIVPAATLLTTTTVLSLLVGPLILFAPSGLNSIFIISAAALLMLANIFFAALATALFVKDPCNASMALNLPELLIEMVDVYYLHSGLMPALIYLAKKGNLKAIDELRRAINYPGIRAEAVKALAEIGDKVFLSKIRGIETSIPETIKVNAGYAGGHTCFPIYRAEENLDSIAFREAIEGLKDKEWLPEAWASGRKKAEELKNLIQKKGMPVQDFVNRVVPTLVQAAEFEFEGSARELAFISAMNLGINLVQCDIPPCGPLFLLVPSACRTSVGDIGKLKKYLKLTEESVKGFFGKDISEIIPQNMPIRFTRVTKPSQLRVSLFWQKIRSFKATLASSTSWVNDRETFERELSFIRHGGTDSEKLQSILNAVEMEYGLKIKKCSCLTGGISLRAGPFLIETDKGKFVIKQLPEGRKNAEFELQFHLALSYAGLPVAQVLRRRQENIDIRNYYIQADKKMFFVEDFIEKGANVSRRAATDGHFYQIGKTMAKMHKVFSADSLTATRMDDVLSRFELLRPEETLLRFEGDLLTKREDPGYKMSPLENELLDSLDDVLDALKLIGSGDFHSLPKSMVHADLNCSNIKFDERGEICGIYDFSLAKCASRIIDFINPLLVVPYGEGGGRFWNKDQLLAMVRGYQEEAGQKGLTREELSKLLYALLAAQILVFCDLAQPRAAGVLQNPSEEIERFVRENIEVTQRIKIQLNQLWGELVKLAVPSGQKGRSQGIPPRNSGFALKGLIFVLAGIILAGRALLTLLPAGFLNSWAAHAPPAWSVLPIITIVLALGFVVAYYFLSFTDLSMSAGEARAEEILRKIGFVFKEGETLRYTPIYESRLKQISGQLTPTDYSALFDYFWSRDGMGLAFPKELKAKLIPLWWSLSKCYMGFILNGHPHGGVIAELVEMGVVTTDEEERFLWKLFHMRAPGWSNRSLDELRELAPQMMALIDREIEQASKPLKILDLGCGPEGRAIRDLKSYHGDSVEAFGVDLEIYDENIEGVTLKQTNIRNLPFEDNSFDLIYEYLAMDAFTGETLKKSISEAMRVLAPGGKFAISKSTESQDIRPALDSLGIAYEITEGEPIIITKKAISDEITPAAGAKKPKPEEPNMAKGKNEARYPSIKEVRSFLLPRLNHDHGFSKVDVDSLDDCAELVKKIIDLGIRKVLVVGSSMPVLPHFLYLLGIEVVYVDMREQEIMLTNKFHGKIVSDARKEGLSGEYHFMAIRSEIGELDLKKHRLEAGSFDLVTLIDLAAVPEGTPRKWLIKARELLKSPAYLLTDKTDWSENGDTPIMHYFGEVFRHARKISEEDIIGTYGRFDGRSTNGLYKVNMEPAIISPDIHEITKMPDHRKLNLKEFASLLNLLKRDPRFSWGENDSFSASVRYDDITHEFEIEPTEECIGVHPELELLEMPAGDDRVPSSGLFGVLRIEIVKCGEDLGLRFREVHPSRGYRQIKPKARRIAQYGPWSSGAIMHIMELAGRSGFKHFYASTAKDREDWYKKNLRTRIMQANLRENYVLPFANGWKEVDVEIDGLNTKFWHWTGVNEYKNIEGNGPEAGRASGYFAQDAPTSVVAERAPVSGISKDGEARARRIISKIGLTPEEAVIHTYDVYDKLNKMDDPLTPEEHSLLFDYLWSKNGIDLAFPKGLKAKIIAAWRKFPEPVRHMSCIVNGQTGGSIIFRLLEMKVITSDDEERFLWQVFHRNDPDWSNRSFAEIDKAPTMIFAIDDVIRQSERPVKVLELGCGPNGNAIRQLKDTYRDKIEAFGVDLEIYDESVEGVTLKEANIRNLPFEDGSFDL